MKTELAKKANLQKRLAQLMSLGIKKEWRKSRN
jgi:hypothetical protein